MNTIGIFVMIGCAFGGAILYLIALQLGYLIGKKHGEERREDKYWDMCRQIAHYDDEQFKSYIKRTDNETYESIGDPYEDGGL